jgi:ABC-type thiamin/hydroxymethylpyrimidine transport system permease subunit
MSISGLLFKINDLILNPIIKLAFAVAFLVFFYGVFQFISQETGDKGREEGKKKIMYGLFGMFIMFSAYGLINLILQTFAIPKPGLLPL